MHFALFSFMFATYIETVWRVSDMRSCQRIVIDGKMHTTNMKRAHGVNAYYLLFYYRRNRFEYTCTNIEVDMKLIKRRSIHTLN